MFQPADAVLVRAAAYPQDLALPAWPDLAEPQPGALLNWLDQAWTLPGFSAAVTTAAPQLATQISRVLDGGQLTERKLHRLTEATVRYLLRWITRATPFGLFSGIAPAALGQHASVRWGDQHHAVTRPDGISIAAQLAAAEADLAVLRSAAVMTNTLGFERGTKWVLPCTNTVGGQMQDTEVGLTGPVRLAIETARSPIPFRALAATLARDYPRSREAAERLLAALVHAQVLLSAIRPPVTVTDPAAYLARYTPVPAPSGQAITDLRVDCAVTLPATVAREAAAAAGTLATVAPPPLAGWRAYHAAFIDRWGPGAAVPLRKVLNVLGFPSGYLNPDRNAFTARDSVLTGLAQRSAVDGCAEVVLDDTLIRELRGEDNRPPVPHTELRFTVAAGTASDLDRGTFTLTVVSGARHAGVTASRFLHLLTPCELERFRRVYTALPTALPGAVTLQLSAPPLDTRLAALARTPELLPVLPAGDFHPAPAWSLADLAVAGDGQRLWLTSQTTGQPVEPLLLNAVLLPGLQQPIVRFLTEIWTAWTAPCARFDWGHAHSLPFLPRLRRGRSILHPARWIIPQAALPGRAATWTEWSSAWDRLRDSRHLPRELLAGDGDTRLRLDLDEKAHLAALRSDINRNGHALLTEAGGPAGWLDGRPAEVMLTLTRVPPATRPGIRPSRPASSVRHQPGASPWLEACITGRPDDILTRLPEFTDLPDGWWFLRYPRPVTDLVLRIPLPAGGFAGAARALAQWAGHLQDDGLLAGYQLATYRPEIRWGTGAALAAAETVFAADSRAAIRHLSGDRQAAAAAGMAAIAQGFTSDGPHWLATQTPHRGGPRLDPAQLAAARQPYGDDTLAAALAAYSTVADRDGLDAGQLLADLLHVHHVRMIGADTVSERHCLRLARAIAQADMATRRPA
jgi:lantibiotic biosynthesis protein